jgi:hypothetical protein
MVSAGAMLLCVRYNEVMLTQARITAACNALHQIDERFCRWLLQSSDRAASDTVALTHWRKCSACAGLPSPKSRAKFRTKASSHMLAALSEFWIVTR